MTKRAINDKAEKALRASYLIKEYALDFHKLILSQGTPDWDKRNLENLIYSVETLVKDIKEYYETLPETNKSISALEASNFLSVSGTKKVISSYGEFEVPNNIIGEILENTGIKTDIKNKIE